MKTIIDDAIVDDKKFGDILTTEVIELSPQTPYQETEREGISQYYKSGCIDKERELWANINCINHINPITCNREKSCDVCERYVPKNPNPYVKETETSEKLVQKIIKVFERNISPMDCEIHDYEFADIAREIDSILPKVNEELLEALKESYKYLLNSVNPYHAMLVRIEKAIESAESQK